MKKILTLSLVVLFSGLLLFGCGKKQSEEEKVEKYTANLEELAQRGKPFKCSFETTDNGLTTFGVYFIDPESQMTKGETKMFMEIEGKTQEVVNYIIAKEGSVYTWQKDNPKGMLFKEEDGEEIEDIETEDAEDYSEEFVFDDKKMEYTCVEWKVDKSVFDLPKDVQFDDISEQMEQYMNMPENVEGMEGLEEMDIDMSQYMNLEE